MVQSQDHRVLAPTARTAQADDAAARASAKLDSPTRGVPIAPIAPALFTTEQAAAYLGMSEAKFHEMRGEPWMCAPIPLGPRFVRWARTDLDAAIAAMPRQAARPGEPTQLLRGKIERMKATGAPA